MARQYSLAHLSMLSVSPPDLVDIAAGAGYDHVGLRLNRTTPEEREHPLMTDRSLLRATRRRLAATGIGVWDVEVARLWPDTEPESYQRFFETGAELGARHVISQLPDPDLGRATERFGRLCQLAAGFGLGVDLEFIAWSHVPDLATAAGVLRQVSQPNAGILVDLMHFALAGTTIDELRSLPAEWFRYVHLCDTPKLAPGQTEQIFHVMRHERRFPGEGDLDVRGIMDCFDPGALCALEIPGDALLAQIGPAEYARRALAASRAHLGPG